MEASLDGLADLPRSGRPAQIGPQARLAVLALASSKPPDGSTRWTTRRLAEQTGLGSTSVHRILNEGRLKRQRTRYWCGRSPDPEFEAKQAAVLGLYLDPPSNALVLCVDEKSQIQALDRTPPELPMQASAPRRLTATYKRHGTACMLAALAVHSGAVSGRFVDASDHEAFLRFLKYLYRAHPRRLTLHFTPIYTSWLTQAKIWFNISGRDALKDAVCHSKAELIRHIMMYIRICSSERAKPFAWIHAGKPLAA